MEILEFFKPFRFMPIQCQSYSESFYLNKIDNSLTILSALIYVTDVKYCSSISNLEEITLETPNHHHGRLLRGPRLSHKPTVELICQYAK